MMQFYTKNRKHQQGFTLIETVVAILILSMTVGALLTLTANGIFSVRYARNQIVANNLAQEALEYIRNSRDSAREHGMSWESWIACNLDVKSNGKSYDPRPDCSDARYQPYEGNPPGTGGAGTTPLVLTNPATFHGCLQSPGSGSFTQTNGCLLDPYTINLHIWEKSPNGACVSQSASTGCRYIWYFPSTGFYGHARTYTSALTGSVTGAGLPVMTTFVRTINVTPSPSDISNELIVTATVEWLDGSTQKTVKQSMVLTNWGQ